MTDAPRWTRYVAIGDSFTEGMCDPSVHPGDGAADGAADRAADRAASGAGEVYRGWADRLAERLHALHRDAGGRGLEYANLAIRGRLLGQILDEQLPVALDARPDLVSLVGGGNDVLRPGSDVDALAERLEDGVARLRAAGADVLLATGVDPRDAPLIRMTRGRVATYNGHIWSIARRHGAYVMDQWGTRALRDWRMWAPDRMHLNDEGHRRVAELAATTLGLPAADSTWSDPLPALPARVRGEALREEVAWVRGHLTPWVQRRLRGRSSGDGRAAKRPLPLPLD
ncbi:SGNH/GDSL hydrolase family protein [Thalassiella azotivora]